MDFIPQYYLYGNQIYVSQKLEGQFISISREEAENYKNECSVLILTATKVETETLHHHLEPISDKRFKVGIDNHTYFIGRFGGHTIFHVQCNAGSVSSYGSTVVANHGIAYCKPKVIIMVGIAFGMDRKKQKIGDILVSETIAPYEVQRLGVEKNIQRGGLPKASSYLNNRFKYHKWEHSFKLTEKGKEQTVSIFQGLILSGEKLIDDPRIKENLKIDFPEAIGGEMEGIGIATSCEPTKLDWIIVKGICDFADGNKKRNKQHYQQIAASNAVNFCKSVLAEPHVLNGLGINNTTVEVQKHNINKVLFKSYQNDVEPYYIERIDDKRFQSFISNYSIWLHGTSGTGKSTLIVRNLTLSGFQLVQINLASASSYNLDSILNDIYVNLSIYFSLSSVISHTFKTDELINEISGVIVANFDFSKHIIYLDEIPEYQSDEVFEKFVQALYVINSNVHSQIPDIKSVFVLSSISSAKKHLHNSQAKMSESFKFMQLDLWEADDISKLTFLINEKLSLKLDGEDLLQIVKVSKGIPRTSKNIIRDYISTLKNENYNLRRILTETEEENR